ncbi:MAG: hypothetical protein HYS13_22645 [Planctomycetia bacterium]|nr:hypothetical protein [Planctomycetia bacterium]
MRTAPAILTWIAALIGAALALAQAPPGGGSAPEEPQARVARLIRQLGSRSYEDRENATVELERLGSLPRKELEAAAASPEAEVSLRATSLLSKIKVAQLWRPRSVTLVCKNEPASKALASIADQTGNRLFSGDHFGPLREATVTADLKGVPFFQALDEICRQSGNQVRPHYDQRNPGLVVTAGDFGSCPLAYAGPVRAKITTARRVFIEEIDYEAGGNETTHTFQFNVQLSWEDQFRLVAYQSQLDMAEAVTDGGTALAAVPSSAAEWKTVSLANRQVTMGLRLAPPPTAAQKLKTMKLRWGLLAVGDMATLEITDLKSTQPHAQDDLELTIVGLQEMPEGRYELTLLVTRDLVIPEPQDVLFQENSFDLFDAKDQPLRKQINHWRWTEAGLRIAATFTPESADRQADPARQPVKLRFTYPRIRARQDLEIIFRDVPLPRNSPE